MAKREAAAAEPRRPSPEEHEQIQAMRVMSQEPALEMAPELAPSQAEYVPRTSLNMEDAKALMRAMGRTGRKFRKVGRTISEAGPQPPPPPPKIRHLPGVKTLDLDFINQHRAKMNKSRFRPKISDYEMYGDGE